MAIEPDDAAGVPVGAGLAARRCGEGSVELLWSPSGHDPGDRAGVILVVMGDADPDRSRIQRSEERADALVGHRQSVPGAGVEEPCGGAGGARQDRGAVAHVEDVELKGLRDRSRCARPEGGPGPREEEHAEARGPEARESPAQVVARPASSEPEGDAREHDEPRGALGEREWCPRKAVHPLEPGDQPSGRPARHLIQRLEGEEEPEPAGRHQEGDRRGGDGRGHKARRAPLPEDAPDHGEGREGGDGARGERAIAEQSPAFHEGDKDRWPRPAGWPDGVQPAEPAALVA